MCIEYDAELTHRSPTSLMRFGETQASQSEEKHIEALQLRSSANGYSGVGIQLARDR
jgi:hypothetical protein